MRNIVAFVVLFNVLFAGCQRPESVGTKGDAGTETVRIVGSSTMAPLVSELAQMFQAAHPRVQFDVQSGGSGRGISEARAGTSHIGMAARALTDKERDLVGFSIARDGVCLVVHKDNPVRGVTKAQVVEVFTGRTANWRALGGAEGPIRVVTRAPGASSLDLFVQFFGVKAEEIKSVAAAAENAEAIKAIVDDRAAITILSIGDVERQRHAGAAIKCVALDGVPASSENIRNGKYPLARPLTLITKTLPAGAAKAFIDFALSPAAAPVIKRYDFVSYAD